MAPSFQSRRRSSSLKSDVGEDGWAKSYQAIAPLVQFPGRF